MAAVAEIVAAQGRVDVLVNNAGFGISGAVEFTELEEAGRQFDVNLFGMARCIRVGSSLSEAMRCFPTCARRRAA